MNSCKSGEAIKTIIITVVILLLVACGGAEERKQVYFTQGNELFSQKSYEKARLEFQNVLQIDPNHANARFMLAKTLEKLNEPRSAAGHFKRTIELDPSNMEAKTRLSRIYVLGGAKENAKELANEVLIAEPNNSTALTVLATVISLDGEIDSAIQKAKEALDIEPENNDTVALLSSLYVKKERYEDAIKLLEQTIAKSNDKSFKIILAGIFINQDEIENAIAIMEELQSSDPSDLATTARLSALYARTKRLEDAEGLLRRTIDAVPDDNEAKMLLVNFIAANQGLDSAIEELKAFISASSKNYELRFGLARLYNQSAKYDDEKGVYQSIIKDDGEGVDVIKAKNALATRYLSENNVEEAKKLINQVLAENATDNDSLVLRGMLALSERKFDDAVSDFRTVLRDQPKLVNVRKLLAKAHIQKQEYELAKDNLQMALNVNKNDLDTKLTLATVLEKLNNKQESIRHVEDVLKTSPKNIRALEMRFKYEFASNELKSSSETASLIATNYPDVALGYYLSALVHAKRVNNKKAIKQLKLALKKQPATIEPLNVLVRLRIAEKQYAKANSELDAILKEYPDHLVARNLKGEVLMISGKEEAAQKEFEKVIEQSPELVTPYINLATLHAKQENYAKAIKTYQKGIDNGANKLVMKMQLASLYQQTDDIDKAILMYEDILKIDANVEVAANNLAMLLASYKYKEETSIKRALDLVAKLKGSKNPAFLDTIGWTYYRAGDYKNALPYLNKALDSAPNEPLLLYHAGMTLYESGEVEQAQQRLKQSIESEKLFLGRVEAENTLEKIAQANTSAMN